MTLMDESGAIEILEDLQKDYKLGGYNYEAVEYAIIALKKERDKISRIDKMLDDSSLVYCTEQELNDELSTKTKQELIDEIIKNFRCLKQITEVVEEW